MAHSTGEHSGAQHHIPSVKLYLTVYAILMVFLFLTVSAAYVDLTKALPVHIPGVNILVMLFIATVKATLVVLFFMNVKNGTRLTWLWAGAGFFWFLTMFQIMMDYFTRNWGAIGWQ